MWFFGPDVRRCPAVSGRRSVGERHRNPRRLVAPFDNRGIPSIAVLERPHSKSSRLWGLTLLGGATLILAGIVACGGDSSDEDGDGPNAAGGLGAYTPGSAASQQPTAPGAGPPGENPNTSSSSGSSSGEDPDAGGSTSSGGAPTDGGSSTDSGAGDAGT